MKEEVDQQELCNKTKKHCRKKNMLLLRNKTIPSFVNHGVVRCYGNKHHEKKSYRLKELEFRHWRENVQLTDVKYTNWQDSFDATISNKKINEGLL